MGAQINGLDSVYAGKMVRLPQIQQKTKYYVKLIFFIRIALGMEKRLFCLHF
jgi:hypothetical protein